MSNHIFAYIENIVIIIVFGILAILFHHLWIVLFAGLFVWTKINRGNKE